MVVEVAPAARSEKGVLRRLMQLYLHDFSPLDGGDVDDHGEYDYPYLDLYWLEDHRHPFLVRVDGTLAGFALVRAGSPHEMAEFHVLRKYRRRAVGTTSARAVFARFPGPWLVHELAGNDAAVAFWRRAIPEPFEETCDGEGTTQRFTVPPPTAPSPPGGG